MVKKGTFKEDFLRKCCPGVACRSNSHSMKGSKETAWEKASSSMENRC